MAKEEPARGPGPCELASGRDWVLRHRPEFEAGLAGKACAALDQTRDWLDVYRGTRGAPPKTISSSSNGDRNGDWSSPPNTVLRNSTIHDFYGFPDPMYKLKYEAPGAIELGKRVKDLLMGEGGMKRVDEDKNRGLDHGAWVPLMLMYPEADIPVCQLSVQSSQSGTYHYNMGKALAPLKDEGVLIIGSGSATHNLRKLDFNITNGSAVPWALAFDHWLRDSLLQGRYGDVNEWEEKAPNAKMAHPWPEHFYPLHVAMGAAGGDAKAEQIHTSWQLGTLSYSSYSFTSSL